jgi:hypothetical protein
MSEKKKKKETGIHSIPGWMCPECRTIYAPYIHKCECRTKNRYRIIDFLFNPKSFRNNKEIFIEDVKPNMGDWRSPEY